MDQLAKYGKETYCDFWRISVLLALVNYSFAEVQTIMCVFMVFRILLLRFRSWRLQFEQDWKVILAIWRLELIGQNLGHNVPRADPPYSLLLLI